MVLLGACNDLCNSGDFSVAKVGNSFCNFVLFYYAINSHRQPPGHKRIFKYENIYLNEYETPKALRRGLNQYIRFYNGQRLYESLGYRCPVDYYRQTYLKLAI